MPNTKAALTIGMNYSGSNKLAGMPTLKAAAECAHQMADFLSSEYDVRCIADVDHGPISPADVEAELDNFFDLPPDIRAIANWNFPPLNGRRRKTDEAEAFH
ncbi:MAG: hypothetical protein AAF700_12685 [Pseudomonadota bacterium]